MARFDGKVAVVTGAGQGVGYHTAKKFVEEGAKVVLIGRTESKLVKFKEELGDNSYVYAMDCGSEEAWKNLVSFLKSEFGEIDYLVNNSAVILSNQYHRFSRWFAHRVKHAVIGRR